MWFFMDKMDNHTIAFVIRRETWQQNVYKTVSYIVSKCRTMNGGDGGGGWLWWRIFITIAAVTIMCVRTYCVRCALDVCLYANSILAVHRHYYYGRVRDAWMWYGMTTQHFVSTTIISRLLLLLLLWPLLLLFSFSIFLWFHEICIHLYSLAAFSVNVIESETPKCGLRVVWMWCAYVCGQSLNTMKLNDSTVTIHKS